MAKLNFQQPFLQSSVSHDPSEIINMLFIIIVKLIVLPNIFVETVKLFFSGFLMKTLVFLFVYLF